MNYMINVLWIDDDALKEDFELSETFMQKAEHMGINIIPKGNYDDGLAWLKQNQELCDAVILDVNCVQSESDSTPTMKTFTINLHELRSICEKTNRIIPWFVYTGGGFEGAKSLDLWLPATEWSDQRYFHKPKDHDLLFENIQREVDKSPLLPLKRKYAEELELCKKYTNQILDIADEIYNKRELKENSFNTLRDVMEWIKEYARDHGLFSEKVITLANATTFIQLVNCDCVPKYIKYTFQVTNLITQEGSHSKYAGKSDDCKSVPVVKELMKEGIATRLLEATFNNVMVLLEWCTHLPKTDDDIQKLRETTDKISLNYDPVTGIVKRDNGRYYVDVDDKGHKCEMGYREFKMKGIDLQNMIGKTVKLINVTANKGKNKDLYQFYAREIEKQ